uniref:Phlebovirus_G2 domain-containing protein n=1 Tax=Haemonchus placei TaxID=6290 RepID=A0A0N4WGT1_HAEPC
MEWSCVRNLPLQSMGSNRKNRNKSFGKITRQSYTAMIELAPNRPIQWKSFSLALNSLGLPRTSFFNSYFISDAIRTAIRRKDIRVPLRRPDFKSASLMDCPIVDNCRCSPAEIHVNRRCSEFSITNWINKTRNQLPVIYRALNFIPQRASKVQARVFPMVKLCLPSKQLIKQKFYLMRCAKEAVSTITICLHHGIYSNVPFHAEELAMNSRY